MAPGKIVPLNDLGNGKSPLPHEPHMIVNRRAYCGLPSIQCRAARALIGWSQDDLSRASRVAKATIANFEAGKREPYTRTREDLREALVSMGVELTNGSNPGVRVKEPLVLALKSVASYVLKHVDMSSGSGPSLRNAEERAERRQKVVDICSKIAELADAARERQIKFPDFEKLRQDLQILDALPTNEQVSAVAHAFQTTGHETGRRHAPIAGGAQELDSCPCRRQKAQ